jgi:hypothetical protein
LGCEVGDVLRRVLEREDLLRIGGGGLEIAWLRRQ